MNIYKKDGSLSTYGYACGYVTRVENKDTNHYKELYKENGVFHLNYNTGNGTESKSYYSISEAAKKFKSIKITF